MTGITVDGQALTVTFDDYGLASYAQFLKAKTLPESEISYDWESDTYRIVAPARFAPLLGVQASVEQRERLPLAGNEGATVATQFYAPAAVYAITPTTEEMARAVARGNQPEPVTRWELRPLQVPSSRVPTLYDDNDEGDGDEALVERNLPF